MPDSFVARLRGAFRRLFRPLLAPRDPWERIPSRVPTDRFGLGSVRRFDWYFDGRSAVAVATVDELCAWLLDCEYVADAELFRERDFWQHPCTFEQIRKGDCEDYALWAWRKLAEMGLESELVVGRRAAGDQPLERHHAWVLFRRDGREYVLEAVARTTERMVRPLSEAHDEYIPHVGVDHRFQTFTFGGSLLAGARPRRASAAPEPPLVASTKRGGEGA